MEPAKKISNKTLCIGFLSNVDSSILKLKSIDGFKIRTMEESEGLRFLAFAENTSVEATSEKVRAVDPILNLKENRFFYLVRTFEAINVDSSNSSSESKPDYTGILASIIGLQFQVQLMRLFKEGDIRVLSSYAFSIDANRKVKQVLRGFQTNQLTSRVPFTLTDDDVPELRDFLRTVHLPLPKDFLRLAFSLFEASYGIREPALSFLCLIISMEVLFNVSQHRVVSREVSTLCAKLLAKDESVRRKIATELLTMYRKRSKVVHYGQTEIVHEVDMLRLRQVVRESIKELLRRGLDKREITRSLLTDH